LALSGIKVVDLTRILAGPFCTMLLADMGAEVVKVEDPKGGDAVRRQGVIKDGLSWYFAQFNRNKKSIALDLRSDIGRDALADLIRGADVLVENYRPGVLAEMGFGPERLEALNPRLVVGSVNGYGSTGPYAARPSFDFIAQAMSGFMSVNGEPDGPPLRSGLPMSDLVAGLYAAFGVVCALHARGRTGRGQAVESALTNGLISMLAYASANHFATGENPKRTGNDHPIASPYGLFHAKDGELAIAPSTEDIVLRLLRALGLEAMLEDPDFATVAQRMKNRARINAAINEKLGRQTVAHWIETLNRAGVPCGRVMGLDEVFADPQVRAQEMMLEVEHPGHGPVRMTGFPVKLSGTPCAVRLPAPELGQHTEEVLRELGWSPERIAALKKRT
jgi:crotonobetainyl-CoA:carnitine CoA-transferase CaiB-like acyl-CoA transferase